MRAGVKAMIYAYRTDIGLRDSNQDYFYVPRDGNKPLIAIADGMGGHRSGNVASLIAIDSVRGYIEAGSSNAKKSLLMQHAINHANARVFEASKTEGCEGMGTTLVMAYLESRSFCFANVGDSRLYLYDGSALTQLTHDHSLVEELVKKGAITREQAEIHPMRNILTRALGTEQYLKADVAACKWKRGDILMLSSDGLHGCVPKKELEWALREGRDLFDCCDLMVELAIWYGSTDNITVVLAKNDCNFEEEQGKIHSSEGSYYYSSLNSNGGGERDA